MLRIDIVAAGRLKKGPLHELAQEYTKRIKGHLKIFEVESKHTNAKAIQADEEKQFLSHMNEQAFVIVLDERGDGLKSLDFAKTIQNFQNNGVNYFQFIIGGADGLTDTVRDRANLLLSFGQQTWPHMMARIMLLEQIYRVQQILSGHPYHRE